MGQDSGLMDSAVPHCESCGTALRQEQPGQWSCGNTACERHGESIPIAS